MCIRDNSYFITSHAQINDYCKDKFTGDVSSAITDLTNDLIKHELIISDTGPKQNGNGLIMGFTIKEKGKSYLAGEIHPFQHLKKANELPREFKSRIWYFVKKYGLKVLIFISGVVITIIIQKIADRYPYFPQF